MHEKHTSFSNSPVLSGRRLLDRQSIRRCAHAIWQQRDRPSGCDLAIWLEAERRISALAPQTDRSIRQRLRDGYAHVRRAHRSETSL